MAALLQLQLSVTLSMVPMGSPPPSVIPSSTSAYVSVRLCSWSPVVSVGVFLINLEGVSVLVAVD